MKEKPRAITLHDLNGREFGVIANDISYWKSSLIEKGATVIYMKSENPGVVSAREHYAKESVDEITKLINAKE